MKIKAGQLIISLIAAVTMAASLSGCGERVTEQTEPQTETSTTVQTESETAAETVKVKETETESETQLLIRSVDYTSKDGSVKITLPDNTWKVTQDADEMRVFQSGSAAMINIVHANTETAMKSLTVMTTQQELQDSLTKQYSDANAFEIESFVTASVNGVNVYRYVVKYFDKKRMWAYSVTNAVVGENQAYVVKGSVMDDNRTLLEEVQTSVESFKVLSDEQLKAATGEIITGTATEQTAGQTTVVKTDTNSADELQTLTNYPTSVAMSTNDDVNVRIQPGTDADYLTVLGKESSVSVVGETANWYKVSVDGNTGYIRKDFLVKTAAPANTAENQQEETTQTETQAQYDDATAAELNNTTSYGQQTTLYATSDVNVRLAPSTDSQVIDGLVTGNAVVVTGETDNWFVVSINGAVGYISKSLLTSDENAAQNTAAEENTSAGDTASAGTDQAEPAAADGTASTGTDTAGTQTDNTASASLSAVSGTVVATAVDSITVQGDDGQSYNIYYGDANVSSQSGIYDGVHVNIALDSTQAAGDGTLYATNINEN